MRFNYFADYLEQNDISLRAAGNLVGRSGTAIATWTSGGGLHDSRVRRKIAQIMNVPLSDVEAEVAKYNAKVQRSTKVISQKSLTSLCKDFIQRIDVATKNNGKPLKPKEKLLIQQIVKSIEMLGEEDEEII